MRSLLLSLGLLLAANAQSSPLGRPSDIILITVDTLRPDHVGCYGKNRAVTPAIDSLCHDGIRFEQAITAAPITNTSHASILTGLMPSAHGVSDFGIPLAPQHRSIASELKQRGYQTAAFIGSVILDSSTLAPGFDRGFDTYDNFPAQGDHWNAVERRAEVVVQHASAWLRRHPAGKRFVWIHLYDPHDPYEPPAPYAARYAKDLYSGEIAYTDEQIAQLLALLKREGRYDNAAIILLSDHGEGLGEHGENTHGIFLYDSTLRVPLILKLPKNERAGATVGDQVSTIDVFPTILALEGIRGPTTVEGKSLLASALLKSRIVISETDYPLRFGWAPLKSARTGGGKYIEAPRPEYYELRKDPGEEDNIYTPWSPEVQSLRQEVARVRKNATAGTNAVPTSTVSELQALGYLGNVVGSTTAADLTILPDPKDKIEEQNLIHDGMVNQDRGRLKEAIEQFSKAVARDPQSPQALLLLGGIELKTNAYREAAQHLQTASTLRPDDTTIAVAYGEALFRAGELQRAVTVLQKAAFSNPGLYRVRVLLGEIFLKQNAFASAADQLEAAILIDPGKPEAYVTLARLKASQGDKVGAHTQLAAALKRDPQNKDAKQLLEDLKKRQ